MEVDITKTKNVSHQIFTENFTNVLHINQEDIQHLDKISAVHYYDNMVLIELNEAGHQFTYLDQYQDSDAACGWVTNNVPCHNYQCFLYKKNRFYDVYFWKDKYNNHVRSNLTFYEAIDYLKDKYKYYNEKEVSNVLL